MSNQRLLKIGVQLQTHEVAPPMYLEVVQGALDIGVDSVFLWDHLVPFTGKQDDVAWDTWSLLGSVAPLFRDRENQLGVLVSPLSIREPAVLARSAATIAHLGNGSFILGVGAGGFEHDDRLTDAPRDLSSRMRLFDRRLQALCSEVGRLNAQLGTDISIWVGGSGERVTIPLAVKYADGWNGFGPASEFALKAGKLTQHDLELSVLLTPKNLKNDLVQYFEAGARHVIRSLRPNQDLNFDLQIISAMISERDQMLGSL